MHEHLGDDELADRWERQALGGPGVQHLDHVRVAWVLLGPDRHAARLRPLDGEPFDAFLERSPSPAESKLFGLPGHGIGASDTP